MKLKHGLAATLAAFAFIFGCVGPQARAQGNFLVNGGFDTDASGWSASNISQFGGFEPAKGNPGGYYFLDAPSSSTDPATISQTVNSLTPGGVYVISGDYAYGAATSTAPSFGVSVNGTVLYSTTMSLDPNWHHFSVVFTADSSTAILTLSAPINGTSVPAAIDNISLVAVPEPSTLCMSVIAVALSTVIVQFRKRRLQVGSDRN
jgi:hypothetical protein